ncbi:MAG: FKBP-type peptidyl-prolyl cis-trans isomerase [Bacteroidota bacterium]|nr:FKBP-type peptidyl-prolyl cis-trans isomerase [Bacteroidota bacterium]
MKRTLFICAIIVVSVGMLIAQQPSKPAAKSSTKKTTVKMKTVQEKMSYLSGFDLGQKVIANVKTNNFPLTTASFINGLRDALEEKANILSPEEIQQVVTEFQKSQPQPANDKQQQEAIAKVKKEGEDFLVVNKLKDSVKTTASGLQYKILREGTGKAPAETSTVTVHYRGRLINGVVFDESYGRGEPTTFALNQVIRGWTEGLQLMTEGAKFEFYIPNQLAYGERSAGQLIAPGSTLIFEVELLSVK